MTRQTRHPRLPGKHAAALLVLLTGLAGCGQKGPLYLPQPPQPAEQPAADQRPAEPAQP